MVDLTIVHPGRSQLDSVAAQLYHMCASRAEAAEVVYLGCNDLSVASS